MLIITGVGFAPQQINVAGKQTIKVTLQNSEAKGLEDVVVVGYAKQKKVTLTGGRKYSIWCGA